MVEADAADALLDGTLAVRCPLHAPSTPHLGPLHHASLLPLRVRLAHWQTYATDVFEQEPPPADSALLACENFHATPHIGAATLEAQARVGETIARNVLATLRGDPPILGEGAVVVPETGDIAVEGEF